MRLVEWDKLPESMKNKEVRYYYEILEKKKFHLVLKRIFDICTASILLILLSPLMLIIAMAIKLTSKGPIFYRQVRITQYGREFKIFKFRTMVVNADKIGTQVTVGNDPRVTTVGNKIRKLRLDEIPQLFNVLLGDMSFVGTRPEVPNYVDKYTKEMLGTLLFPAGITSKASIEFKDEDKLLDGAIDVDLEYVDNVLPLKMKINIKSIEEFSFLKDITVLFNTVKEVFISNKK